MSSRSSVVAYIANSVYFATLRSPRSTAIATSEHIRFSCFLFRFPFFPPYYFLVPCDRRRVYVKIASRIVSYRKHFSTFFFNFVLQRFYSAPNRRARSIAMSVSVCLCVFVCPRSHLRNYTSDLHQVFLRTLPLAVARFSSGGVVIRYLFPVLCMTSY